MLHHCTRSGLHLPELSRTFLFTTRRNLSSSRFLSKSIAGLRSDFFTQHSSHKPVQHVTGTYLDPSHLSAPLSDSPSAPRTASTTSSSSSMKPEWSLVKRPATWRELLSAYSQLSKSRLATLVVLTTMSGYAMAPAACSLSALNLAWTTAGTGLCVLSANAFNQWMEVPYDAQMQRTRARLLVQQRLSSLHAFNVALGSGLAGVFVLASQVNAVTAFLGALNILLYAGVYTPMKRLHLANTWFGSLVGAIPPMMGWAAVTGNPLDVGSLLLGTLLFAWQFPHFNALSFLARQDYAQAGYRMLASTHPRHNANVSWRYTLLLNGLGWVGVQAGLVTSCFLWTSLPIQLGMLGTAWRFKQQPTNEKRARQLFGMSLIYLPVMIVLMLVHKSTWPRDEKRTQQLEQWHERWLHHRHALDDADVNGRINECE